MTLPLAPAPRLSSNARPQPPIDLPPPPPDRDRATRQLLSGVTTDREASERQLLANALAAPAGVEALRTLDPQELSTPLHRNVAQAIVDLADKGQPHDGAAVTAELASRPLFPEGQNTQLPIELNPNRHPNPGDLRTFGLRGWEYSALAVDSISHPLAQQVRAYTRQERGLEAAQRAVARYGAALETGGAGPVVDWVGHATHELATEIVAIPKALPSVHREPTGGLDLPTPPRLSPAGQRAVRP
jgi:hypothetical protein